jgi:hypothetical protein
LRTTAINIAPQTAKHFYEELLKTEHAILVSFVWFVMNRTGDYVFEIPGNDLSIPYDCNELIEELKNQFLWPEIDPISPCDYQYNDTLQISGPGYFRLKIPSKYFSTVDIFLSFYEYNDGVTDFSDYKKRADAFVRKEIYKVLQTPLSYLEDPEGRMEEIEKTITIRNFYDDYPGELYLHKEPPLSPQEESRRRTEDIIEGKKKMELLIGLGYKPGFVLIDPRLIEQEKEWIEYKRIKENFRNEYGWDILKSPDDLLDDFVEESAQYEIKSQWREIVDNAYREIIVEINENNKKEFLKYEAYIRKQICCWSQLDDLSKTYLRFAEFFFNQSKDFEAEDFSAPALLYCKSLENEIREKLFGRFTVDITKKHVNFSEYFAEDLKESNDTEKFWKKIAKDFAKKIANCEKDKSPAIELGLMANILKFTYEKTETSLLFGELKQFISKHFKDDSPFWREIHKIHEITTNYRNKSAHPNGKLSQNEAEKCREEVLILIDRFLISEIL